MTQAQVYTERASVADRKIYPLFGSRREENVQYPGAVGLHGAAQPSHNET